MEHGKLIFCIECQNKRETIARFYWQESEVFHKTIHKRAGTVEENIQDMIDTISPESVMYEVKVGDKLAAFFVKYEKGEDGVLEGFHVDKEFRKGWFLHEFWRAVDEKFGKPYSVGLYEKNTPAIRHLVKQGFIEYVKTEFEGKTFVILKR